jgi:spore coat protein CotH
MGGMSDGNYSLQFKANKYIKGQTFYGLDVFCVNNMVGDATYMKDYIAYDMMNYIGVATPLTNYASITVNGKDYGFGIMLERYEQSFLNRVYNTSSGSCTM